MIFAMSPEYGVERCILRNINSYDERIYLRDGEPKILGRWHTGNGDVTCALEQLSVVADFNTRTATVVRLGPMPSALNGVPMIRYVEYTAYPEDELELVFGHEDKFRLEFDSYLRVYQNGYF